MIYEKYKHPKWQRLRLRVLERDGWKCVACGDENSTLHVHHAFYSGDPWDVPEDSLQALCDSCHSALGQHPKGGVYWEKKTGGSVIRLRWCPACSSGSFYSDGEKYRCSKCYWDSSRLNHRKLLLGENVTVSVVKTVEDDLKIQREAAAGLVTAIDKYLESSDDQDNFAAVCEKIVQLRRSWQYSAFRY